jgi:peptide/nickel transport system permease protein
MRLLRYILKRVFSLLITLLITTALLYAMVMLTPPATRATLYMPKNISPRISEEQYQKMLKINIEHYHLNDPYPVQYFTWLTNLIQGNWGYSPMLKEDVFTGISRRAPMTAELTLLSILIYFPLGLISGVFSASRNNKVSDHGFQIASFIATSLPPFILAILMIVIFYIGLGWFAPGRMSTAIDVFVKSKQFHQFTGMLTIDGLLNGRLDISLDGLRHLIMPACTLAFAHWATLGRVTRTTMIEELQQDYVTAAKARGISRNKIVWEHALPNAVPPAITSSLISAASLLTGVFVVEIIFNLPGISSIAVYSMAGIPDAPAALGFAIYSVMVVLILMSILDLIQYLLDPRIREKI